MSELNTKLPSNPAAREPGSLSIEYHKAHKQSLLWAAILLFWELVGINLTNASATPTNFGALAGSIESPQAIPWAFLILMAYFLFKLALEWAQCNEARKRRRASRIDFVSPWIVSFLAVALYIVQAISHVQIADVIRNHALYTSVIPLALMIGVSSIAAQRWIADVLRERDWFSIPFGLLWIFCIGLVILMVLTLAQRGRMFFAITVIFGAAITHFFHPILSGISYLVVATRRLSNRIVGWLIHGA